jgi:hypothetical protein
MQSYGRFQALKLCRGNTISNKSQPLPSRRIRTRNMESLQIPPHRGWVDVHAELTSQKLANLTAQGDFVPQHEGHHSRLHLRREFRGPTLMDACGLVVDGAEVLEVAIHLFDLTHADAVARRDGFVLSTVLKLALHGEACRFVERGRHAAERGLAFDMLLTTGGIGATSSHRLPSAAERLFVVSINAFHTDSYG